MNRIRLRPRGIGTSATAYDADAQAYIAATGALFPEALNALVLGIKAAGLWDNHLGSLKLAIGVPTLAASLVDLRNPAFNATAVNAPGHSATAGWSFARTSSQYINQAWRPGATDSKGTLNSTHFGIRQRTAQPPGQGSGAATSYGNPSWFGFINMENGFQIFGVNDTASGNTASYNPVAPASYVISRTASNVVKLFRNGAVSVTSAAASSILNGSPPYLGARNVGSTPDNFVDIRLTAVHGGAGLDDAQAAALTILLDAYAAVCGET